jgi:hypothetical protein
MEVGRLYQDDFYKGGKNVRTEFGLEKDFEGKETIRAFALSLKHSNYVLGIGIALRNFEGHHLRAYRESKAGESTQVVAVVRHGLNADQLEELACALSE